MFEASSSNVLVERTMPLELVRRVGDREGEMCAGHVPPGVSLSALDACYDTWQLPACSSLSGSFASPLPQVTAVSKCQENPIRSEQGIPLSL